MLWHVIMMQYICISFTSIKMLKYAVKNVFLYMFICRHTHKHLSKHTHAQTNVLMMTLSFKCKIDATNFHVVHSPSFLCCAFCGSGDEWCEDAHILGYYFEVLQISGWNVTRNVVVRKRKIKKRLQKERFKMYPCITMTLSFLGLRYLHMKEASYKVWSRASFILYSISWLYNLKALQKFNSLLPCLKVIFRCTFI